MKKSFTEEEFDEVFKVWLENQKEFDYWAECNGLVHVKKWYLENEVVGYCDPEFTYYILKAFKEWISSVKKYRITRKVLH